MNIKKNKLKEIKEFYQTLVWTITKGNSGIKLSRYKEDVLNQYNLILDLIEDIEELKARIEGKENGNS